MTFSQTIKQKIILTVIIFAISLIIYQFFTETKQEIANILLSEDQLNQIFSFKQTHDEHLEVLNSLNEGLLMKQAEFLKERKIIIAGITRDNAKDLASVIYNIEKIGKIFLDYKVIIFENDSIDGTKQILLKWASLNDHIKILTQDFANKKRPSHLFLAHARNFYLNEINHAEYNDFDYVLILDLDMKYGLDIRGLKHSFNSRDDWDAVCANGIYNSKLEYYDGFAFRNKQFPLSPQEWQKACSSNENNIYKKICSDGDKFSRGIIIDFLAFSYSQWQYKNKLYWLKIMPQILHSSFKPNQTLQTVYSCFGGLAIYKRAKILGCFYDSINNDCEHVAFNQCLRERNHGKIVINPAMLIRYSHYKN